MDYITDWSLLLMVKVSLSLFKINGFYHRFTHTQSPTLRRDEIKVLWQYKQLQQPDASCVAVFFRRWWLTSALAFTGPFTLSPLPDTLHSPHSSWTTNSARHRTKTGYGEWQRNLQLSRKMSKRLLVITSSRKKRTLYEEDGVTTIYRNLVCATSWHNWTLFGD